MKVEVKQTRAIDGQAFHPGTHEVPDTLVEHWYFKACMADGSIVVLEGPDSPVEPIPQPQLSTSSLNEAGEVVSTPLPNPDAVPTADPAGDGTSTPTPDAAPAADVPAPETAPAADVAPDAAPAEETPAPDAEVAPVEEVAPDAAPEVAPEPAPVEDAPEVEASAAADAETAPQPDTEPTPAEDTPAADVAPASDVAPAADEPEHVVGEVYTIEGVTYVAAAGQEEGEVALQPVDQLTDDERAALVASGKLSADVAAADAGKTKRRRR